MTSIISTDESHVTFARALASPDKEIRDKTVKSLINYVSTLQEITELEMLKLWKALYYCMWLSDKAPIQMELALALSGLFRSFKNMDFAVMFYRLFFRTMIREWTLLDQHRINKFYTLIRLMLREGLSFMYKSGWSAESVDSLLDVLEEEVLVKTPNGLRLHIADIFLQELLTASNGDINSDAFMRVLRPFFAAVQGCLDKSFQERVILKVFSAFVTDHAREHRGSDETVTEARKHLFLNVQTSIVQSMIFSTASDSDTLEKNRRRIYTLHQEFPPVTGLPFASMDEIEDTEEMQIEIEKEEKVAVKSGTKEVNGSSSSSKKAVKAVAVSHKLENEIVVEKEVVKVSKKRTAEVESDEKNQKVPRKDINPVATSSASSKSAEVVPAVAEVEKKRKVEDKRKEVAAPLPVANMVAVPSPAARAAEATTTAVAAPFIESKRFTGGKLGYVFKKGKSGLGYYTDAAQMKRHAKQLAKANPVKAPTIAPTPAPVATTMIVDESKASKKKAKKEAYERRQSGDFPPAESVRIDDLVSQEDEESESKVDRKVRFGKPQSKGYIDSINGLKSGASPHASLTPSHSALKSQSKSSSSKINSGGKDKSKIGSSPASLSKSSAKKNNTGGKASSTFLAGRAN